MIDAKGVDGCKPLHFARDIATARLLVERGALPPPAPGRCARQWLDRPQPALAAARKPDDASIRANLGEVLLRLARFEEASAEFQRALALAPDGRDPGANRARAILHGMEVAMRELNAA
ncbi:MAG: hypothetical protein HYR60_07850 [Acidobacteria bacterium]|nr:hypothetical protein [Acidobacteriota bacterium]